MKNVLFATTALVAFAGVASAQAVSFSGEMTAGYNDAVDGGMFYDANIDATAVVDMGGNVTATLTGNIVTGNEGGATSAFKPTIEIAYTGSPMTASLRVGDLNDKGASEYFYASRSGMALIVENQDAGTLSNGVMGGSDARALVQFGKIGVAVGCQLGGTNSCQGVNVGAGATFGSIKLGIGYDDAANGGAQRTAVSADATFGSASVGASYITDGTNNSTGVEVGYTVSDALSLGAYFASNSAASDEYGVSVDYTAGAMTVGVSYDNNGASSYGVDLGYAVNDKLTANAGYFNGSAKVYTAPGTSSSVVGGYYYVGVDYAVNDSITATVSYATADAISGPEYKQGITALITASF